MLIVMEQGASDEDVLHVVARIEAMGLRAHTMPGALRTAIGVTGNETPLDPGEFESLPGVQMAVAVTQPRMLVSRETHPQDTRIEVGDQIVGAGHFVVIAGPCAVESLEQTLAIAQAVKAAGAHILRGGAFKPRTSPYSFQGVGLLGLKILARAREETGLPVVTEAMDVESLGPVADHADIVQIGARSMQNFPLLKKAGRCGRPILLKRGTSATVDELLMSAEYIASEGNTRIVLCERGVRGFSTHTRYTLDLSAVPAVKAASHLPIIVDPSHGTGKRGLIAPMARAAVASGADGVMIEVHDHPDRALSDGSQAILPRQLAALISEIRAIAGVVGMKV